MLAAVKAWPGSAGACRPAAATAILDGVCARRQPDRAGRDGETASRSNKETGQKDQKEKSGERSNGPRLTNDARPSTASGVALNQTTKRTNDVLPKPDNLKSYRQS